MGNIPRKLRCYITFLFFVSAIVLYLLFINNSYFDLQFLITFILLSIIAESLPIPLPNEGAVSVGFAISLASIIIGGPLTGALVTAFGFLFRIVKLPGRGYIHLLNTPIYKTIFNVSQMIIVIGLAGIVYTKTGGIVGSGGFITVPIPILSAVLVYIILNTIIIANLMSILSGQNFIKMWIKNIKDLVPNAIAVGALGLIIALAYFKLGAFAVVIFFGPLLLARHSYKLYMDMKHVYMETIQALTNAMEAKDAYTSGHAERVGKYAVKLARALNLSDRRIENIKNAAILHDIGKIGIDDQILRKPGKLTYEEYEKIKKHPSIGAEILKEVNFLKEVSSIVRHHHERYDGKGYPDGLKEDEIPVEAAILAIADVYDAMTSDRPYRKALTKEVALSEIEKNAGTQFNPEFAKMFVKVMRNEGEKEMLTNVN
ncbi:HDIG domain-containing protein [Caloranaerobacter azorensis DSM 13643]|uniref:HDIG domain-containing protein n=1 Tax=Caloranaerobacter azorensis DSM 13643 TaxID=1121264 RepID=A0A1M5TE77_9FIRM|nr:HD-GYP domain-containing protein [Caloranaerobacter azorensis]SHH49032.1 HDIG domain-containing protein [Caloranaerobacter azorensis DSM 13643]